LRALAKTDKVLVLLRCNFAFLIATYYLSIETGLQTGQPRNRGSISVRDKEFVSTPMCPFLPLKPTQLPNQRISVAVSVAFIPLSKDDNLHLRPRLLESYFNQFKYEMRFIHAFSSVVRQIPGYITRKNRTRLALFPVSLTTLGSNPRKPSNKSC
jgi:hypothetical protein